MTRWWSQTCKRKLPTRIAIPTKMRRAKSLAPHISEGIYLVFRSSYLITISQPRSKSWVIRWFEKVSLSGWFEHNTVSILLNEILFPLIMPQGCSLFWSCGSKIFWWLKTISRVLWLKTILIAETVSVDLVRGWETSWGSCQPGARAKEGKWRMTRRKKLKSLKQKNISGSQRLTQLI